MLFWHYCCAPSSSDSGTGAAGSGSADISSLIEMLGTVWDPLGPRGRQYPLTFVLAVCMVATLAGVRNYAEIARRVRDMPQPLLKMLGEEWNWLKLRYQWPDMSVIRNALTGSTGTRST